MYYDDEKVEYFTWFDAIGNCIKYGQVPILLLYQAQEKYSETEAELSSEEIQRLDLYATNIDNTSTANNRFRPLEEIIKYESDISSPPEPNRFKRGSSHTNNLENFDLGSTLNKNQSNSYLKGCDKVESNIPNNNGNTGSLSTSNNNNPNNGMIFNVKNVYNKSSESLDNKEPEFRKINNLINRGSDSRERYFSEHQRPKESLIIPQKSNISSVSREQDSEIETKSNIRLIILFRQ